MHQLEIQLIFEKRNYKHIHNTDSHIPRMSQQLGNKLMKRKY